MAVGKFQTAPGMLVEPSSSPLAYYYREANNHGGRRTVKIDTITIHAYSGHVSAQAGADYFATTDRIASSNYVIGDDCKISVSVPESCRSYCSSNSANDNRAVTIEVSSDSFHPYKIHDDVFQTLIDLVTDICRRNGITQLIWSDKKDDRVNHRNGCNMTVHRDWEPLKACPGQYIYDREAEIAAIVNSRLTALIESFSIDSVSATGLTASFTAGQLFKDYTWYYNLYSLANKLLKSGGIHVNKEDAHFSVSNLTPNTPYLMEVTAKSKTLGEIVSPRLMLVTERDRPGSVSRISLTERSTRLPNLAYTVKFTSPASWGATNTSNKGYRISIVVNGKIVSYSDSLLSYNGSRTATSVSIALNNSKLRGALSKISYQDTIQIGVQTWIKIGNEMIFDCEQPQCSKPIYLKYFVDIIDKLYVKTDRGIKRAMLFCLDDT